MELILIQRAGQLGDAFLVELVQTVVQPACAVIQLACTGVQGVHAVIQGLGACGQLSAAILCRVGTIRSGLHACGVLVHAGNKELNLRKAGLQGADISHILTVLHLILQLSLGGVLGILAGQQLYQTAQHGGVVVLHQLEGCFQIVVRLGRGQVQGQIQLAVLEAGSLLPHGAHDLAASGSEGLIVHGEDVVDHSLVVRPCHVLVDQAAFLQGLVGRSQHTVRHLLRTGVQCCIVGAQGVQTVGQLAKAVVQSGSAVVQGVGTVQQGQNTVCQLRGAVHQLGSAVHELAHGVVQLVDAVGQVVDAAQVEHIARAQSGRAGGTGHHDLRAGQLGDICLNGNGILQIVFDAVHLVGQQAGQGILHARQGDKGGNAALGGALDHAVFCSHVGCIPAQNDAHSGDQRGDDGAVLAVHVHGAGLIVLQGNGHGQMAALADEVFQRSFLPVQSVGHLHIDGQGLVGIALVVNIGVLGVPDQLFAVLGELGIALGVLDVGQGGLVGDAGQAGGAVQVLADGGVLDGAVAVHHSIDGLGFGKAALTSCKCRHGAACGECQSQRRTGETKRFFHNAITPFQTSWRWRIRVSST